MYELIDLLQASKNYYFVDYVPYTINNPNFLELEEYFEYQYLSEFAEKIVRIALKVIYLYPCQIYLTAPDKIISDQEEFSFDVDIRNSTPEKIANAIRQVILTDFSSVQILFSNPEFLVSIGGGFSVTIYNLPKDTIILFEQLVNHEGLFLKNNV